MATVHAYLDIYQKLAKICEISIANVLTDCCNGMLANYIYCTLWYTLSRTSSSMEVGQTVFDYGSTLLGPVLLLTLEKNSFIWQQNKNIQTKISA